MPDPAFRALTATFDELCTAAARAVQRHDDAAYEAILLVMAGRYPVEFLRLAGELEARRSALVATDPGDRRRGPREVR